MIEKVSSEGKVTQEARIARLKAVCAEFEAIFLSHLLKTMRSTVSEGGLFGKSHQAEVMGSVVDEKVALDLAGKRGIGIGDLLLKQLQASHGAFDAGRAHGTGNDSDD